MASHNLAFAPLPRPLVAPASVTKPVHPELRLVINNRKTWDDGSSRNPALGAAICLGFSGAFWGTVLLALI